MAPVEITVEKRGYPVTAVLFAGLAPRRKAYEWWGTFQDMPANVVAVRDPHYAWWQVETREAFDAIDDAIQEAFGSKGGRGPILSLGASAGGFGALLFAGLRGGGVVAFSPQTICGQGKRDLGDLRWPERCNAVADGKYSDVANSPFGWPATVHYAADDPADCIHAERLCDLVRKVKYVSGGHNLVEHMRNDGRLHRIIRKAIDDLQ